MKLEVIPTNKLTYEEFKTLRRLTLGPKRGYMFDDLDDLRYRGDGKVIRLTEDNGKVLSWGLVFDYDERGNKDFQVYTRSTERRKGYGKIVYDKAVQVAQGRAKMIVHPHTGPSVGYFNKLHYGPAKLPLQTLPKKAVSNG